MSQVILRELLARHPENKQWTDLEIRLLDFSGGYLDTLAAKDVTLGQQAAEAYREAYETSRTPQSRGTPATCRFSILRVSPRNPSQCTVPPWDGMPRRFCRRR